MWACEDGKRQEDDLDKPTTSYFRMYATRIPNLLTDTIDEKNVKENDLPVNAKMWRNRSMGF